MKKVWVLSKFYDCPEHEWPWPVCTAYGDGHYSVREADSDWALVKMDSSPQHVEAMKEDPRVIYCGRDHDTPPTLMLQVFKDKLAPGVNYMFVGQIIAALAQTNPGYYHEE
jgi:hypothetical protein